MKTAKLIAILVLTVALGIIVIQNSAPIQTRFLFITVEMPQILLLLLIAVVGFCLGLLVALWGKRDQRESPGGS